MKSPLLRSLRSKKYPKKGIHMQILSPVWYQPLTPNWEEQSPYYTCQVQVSLTTLNNQYNQKLTNTVTNFSLLAPYLEYLIQGTLLSDKEEAHKISTKSKNYTIVQGVLYRKKSRCTMAHMITHSRSLDHVDWVTRRIIWFTFRRKDSIIENITTRLLLVHTS